MPPGYYEWLRCASLLLLLLQQQFTDAARSLRCYSCMSEVYGSVWEYAGYDKIYTRPLDFTNHCKGPTESLGVRPMECTTTCVKMEHKISMGGKSLMAHSRGCYENFFVKGFNRSSQVLMRMSYKEQCGNFSLKAMTDSISEDQFVTLCSCASDLCNGAERLTNLATARFSLVVVLLLITTAASSSLWWRIQ